MFRFRFSLCDEREESHDKYPHLLFVRLSQESSHGGNELPLFVQIAKPKSFEVGTEFRIAKNYPLVFVKMHKSFGPPVEDSTFALEECRELAHLGQ
jgi:hypothetical protein